MASMIFNVVVDVVIRHWVMVVAATEAGAEVLGTSIQDLASYFYAGERVVTLPQPERLHRSFGVLAELFNRVGLQSITRKMVIMSC